ncbi:MAG: trypsin-like peptidase domain-containing protein [Saprospiraceae bacterium]|nr:trypsin-like peptidase domain-containing protein [Saprospiraceae bacterium]
MFPTTKEHLRRSIVRIQGKSRGTGFWIKGKDGQVYVLTCAHVAGVTGSKPEVRFYKSGDQFCGTEEAVEARVKVHVAEDKGDIALLSLPADSIPLVILPLQLLDIQFSDLPPFAAYGFPAAVSDHGRFAEGRLGSVVSSNEARPLFQLMEAEEIRKGFSGGPVVHTSLGYVLGMISDQEQPDDTSKASISYALTARFIAQKLPGYFDIQTLHPYDAWLSSLYHEVVLNDDKGMRLSDVYVEPFYGIHESCVEKERKPYEGQQTKGGFYPVEKSVHEAINHKLARQFSILGEIEKNQLTLLLGYPGQGKTSFSKRVLHDHLMRKTGRPAYLVRLRYIADPRILRDNPFPFLENEIALQAQRSGIANVPMINFSNALLIRQPF